MQEAPQPSQRPERLLGIRLRELREQRGWTQEDLIQRMRAAGFSWHPSTVTKVEQATRPVRVDEAVAVAEIFSLRLNDLVPQHIDLVMEADKEDGSEGDTAEQILGRRVAALRQRREWSPDDLATRMRAAGHPWRQSHVTRTEQGDRPVRLNEAATLAEMFDIPVEELIRQARPALLVRLDEANQDMRRHTMQVREADMRLVDARGRLDAIESLVAYWRHPSKHRLHEAARMVMYDCEDWRELLIAAGIPSHVIGEVTQQANVRLKAGEPLLEGEEDGKDQLVRLVTEGLLDWFKTDREQDDG